MLKARYSIVPLAMLCAGTIACSSTDESGEPSEEPTGTGGGGNVENGLPDPNGGLEWPAGHSEPCANPLDTGYMNDELCLEPPAPDVGFQVHFGPSDYDDPVEMSNFLLQPGAENVVCQFRHTPDFEGVRYSNEQHTRLRSGTHHYIMWSASVDDAGLSSPPPPDGTYSDDSCQNPFEYLFTTGSQAALSEQGGILDIPLPGGEPPENQGLGKLIYPNRSIAMEMHYVNTTGEVLLREGWTNTIYVDKSEVETLIDPLFLIGASINVPPGGSQIVQANGCVPPEVPPDSKESKYRLLGITGHAHASTTRITAWIDRAATGQRERVYEVYDWSEPLNAQFSSMHTNPPMGDGINDGAHTGILTFEPGDTFSWECEMHNQTDKVLRFGNFAYTAEMCNIFGFAVPGNGGMWACFK
jgi:hypothetical protein